MRTLPAFLSPRGIYWYVETCRLLFFVGDAVNEINRICSRYFVDGLSEQDKIWQIDRGGFAVHQFQDLANRHLFPEFGEL